MSFADGHLWIRGFRYDGGHELKHIYQFTAFNAPTPISGSECRYSFGGKSECCISGGHGGESLGSQKMRVERRVKPQFRPRQWTRVVLPAKLLSRFNYINRPTTTTMRALVPLVMQFKMISRLVFTHTPPPPHTSTVQQPWSSCGRVFPSLQPIFSL